MSAKTKVPIAIVVSVIAFPLFIAACRDSNPSEAETPHATYIAVPTFTSTPDPRQSTVTPTPRSPTSTAHPVAKIVNRIDVHAGPDPNYPIIGQTAPGARYLIRGKNPGGDWWQINYKSKDEWVLGWIHAPLVESVNSQRVKIVNTPPLPLADTPVPPTPTPLPPTIAPPAANPRPTATPRSTAGIVKIINVRAGPGTNYHIVGQASPGQQYRITGKNRAGDWWQIIYGNQRAWVYAPLVNATNPENVQITAAPSMPRPINVPKPLPSSHQPGSDTFENTNDPAVVSAAIMLVDYLNDQQGWTILPEAQKNAVAQAYQTFIIFAADYCGLSYADLATLVDWYGDVLDEAGFISPDGAKSRGFLLAFIYGFGSDGTGLAEVGMSSCVQVLERGVLWGLGQ